MEIGEPIYYKLNSSLGDSVTTATSTKCSAMLRSSIAESLWFTINDLIGFSVWASINRLTNGIR